MTLLAVNPENLTSKLQRNAPQDSAFVLTHRIRSFSKMPLSFKLKRAVTFGAAAFFVFFYAYQAVIVQ